MCLCVCVCVGGGVVTGFNVLSIAWGWEGMRRGVGGPRRGRGGGGRGG